LKESTPKGKKRRGESQKEQLTEQLAGVISPLLKRIDILATQVDTLQGRIDQLERAAKSVPPSLPKSPVQPTSQAPPVQPSAPTQPSPSAQPTQPPAVSPQQQPAQPQVLPVQPPPPPQPPQQPQQPPPIRVPQWLPVLIALVALAVCIGFAVYFLSVTSSMGSYTAALEKLNQQQLNQLNSTLSQLQNQLKQQELKIQNLQDQIKQLNQTLYQKKSPTVEEVSSWLRSIPQGWNATTLAKEIEKKFGLQTKIVEHEGVNFLFVTSPSWEKWWWATYRGLLTPPTWFTP